MQVARNSSVAATEIITEVNPEEINQYLSSKERIVGDLQDRILEESAKNFGIVYPAVVVPNATGKFTLVDGYRRYVVAKRHNLKLPVIIKQWDNDTSLLMRIALNLSQKPMELDEAHELAKQIRVPSMLKLIGLTTPESYALRNIPKEIAESLKHRPPEVVVEVAKVAVVNREKAKELVALVKRTDAKSAKEVSSLKEMADKLKVGIRCGLCGKHLKREEVNWMAVCSYCKWLLMEEFRDTMFDRMVKDWITGHRCDDGEAIVISKRALFDLLSSVPEDVRLNNGLQHLYQRLEAELNYKEI